MSSGRKEAELFYKRRLDNWKSRSSRILYKAQSLNRTQDRRLVNELDVLEKNRDLSIRHAFEDIWKVSNKDCPVQRLPKPSDLPSYLAGAKQAPTTLPTPQELACLLPKKIIRKKDSAKQRYKVIPKKRLSLMTTSDIQVFHYRQMLEKQVETKTVVAGFFISALENDDEDADKSTPGIMVEGSNADTSENATDEPQQTVIKPKRKLGMSMNSKWALVRNELKEIREQNEDADESKEAPGNTDKSASGQSVTAGRGLSTAKLNEKPPRKNSATNRHAENTTEPVSTSLSPGNHLKVPPRHIRPQSSPLITNPGERTIVKKQRPSTSTGISDQMLKNGGNKILKTNYLDMYRKQMLEHKQRMSTEGNLSEGMRRRRSSISTTPISSAERQKLIGQNNAATGLGTPSKNTLNATMSSTMSGRRSPGARANSPSWSTPHGRDSNNNTLNATMSSTGSWSGRSSPINGTPVRKITPPIGDPSSRGIRQPGPVKKEKRQSTLMKETAASSKHKTLRLLKRTESGALVTTKVFEKVQEMRNKRMSRTEQPDVTVTDLDGNIAPEIDIIDVDDGDEDLFETMRNCRYIRWGDDQEAVDKLNEEEPLTNQLSAMRLDMSPPAKPCMKYVKADTH